MCESEDGMKVMTNEQITRLVSQRMSVTVTE